MRKLPSLLCFALCFFSATVPAHAVIHGAETSGEPSVVSLEGESGCTGTAVSDSTVITAEHCVKSASQFQGQRPRKILTSAEVDLAVLVFPAGTFSAHSSLLPRTPRPGEAITVVGYGRTSLQGESEDSGAPRKKRIGHNRLLDFAHRKGNTMVHGNNPDLFLHYRAPQKARWIRATDAMPAVGDSGGPIFVEGKLAGVVYFGDSRSRLVVVGYDFENEISPSGDPIYEYDVSLHSAPARRLLQRAAREIGAKISGLGR